MQNVYFKDLLCFYTLLVLLLTFYVQSHALSDIDDVINTITSFTIQNHAVSSVIFLCWKKTDIVQLMRACSHQGLHVQLYHPKHNTDLSKLLESNYHPISVIVDLECVGSYKFLKQVSKQKLFTSLHYWLLFSSSNTSDVDIIENLSHTELESLYLPIDSHVTVTYQESEMTNLQVLQDIYHTGAEQSLTVTKPRYWERGLKLPSPPARTDYKGTYIKIAFLVPEGSWETFLDPKYRHLNTDSKVHYVLIHLISKMLNFRIKAVIADTWGYPVKGSKCYNGVVGELQCGDCEIGASGLLHKIERMPIIDYCGITYRFRGAFMFLKPLLSEVSVIYELPFNTSVWIAYTTLVAILTVVLFLTRYIYKHVNPSSANNSTVGWTDTIMDSIAIVCQQDALHVPKNVSSRVVFFSMLILTVFILTSYSATIVSLLQTSTNKFNTIHELMKSPLKLSMINLFVNETTDPAFVKIFKEKLYTQPFKEAFTTEEVGIQKIRTGLFAYHGLSGSYKVISDTYEEHEKCRFKEIEMFTSMQCNFISRKGSPYSPHIKEKTAWLKEVGLIDREDKRWFYQRPRCISSGQSFASVRIQDFYPALVVLAYGISASVALLIAETLYNKREAFKYCVGNTATLLYNK